MKVNVYLPAPEGTTFSPGCFDLMIGNCVALDQGGETIYGTVENVSTSSNSAVLELEVSDMRLVFDPISFSFMEDEEDE